MEIDQLTVTPISLTFRMKAFLHDDFVPLGTPIIVFLDSVTVMENHSPVRSQRRLEVTLGYVVIAPCINIEYKLDAKEE